MSRRRVRGVRSLERRLDDVLGAPGREHDGPDLDVELVAVPGPDGPLGEHGAVDARGAQLGRAPAARDPVVELVGRVADEHGARVALGGQVRVAVAALGRALVAADGERLRRVAPLDLRLVRRRRGVEAVAVGLRQGRVDVPVADRVPLLVRQVEAAVVLLVADARAPALGVDVLGVRVEILGFVVRALE